MRPPFEVRAKAATARSISSPSRMLIGLTSTLRDGAAVWMAANMLVPEPWAVSRRTATRVTLGAPRVRSGIRGGAPGVGRGRDAERVERLAAQLVACAIEHVGRRA